MKISKTIIAIGAGALVLAGAAGAFFAYNYFHNRNSVTSVSKDVQVVNLRTNTQLCAVPPIVSNTTHSDKFNSRKIANWNLQIFGDKKAANSKLMDAYVNVLTNFDIAFVQEIRDHDDSAFTALSSRLTNYLVRVSSRAGRSSSKEQYGVIYKKGIKIEKMVDYNPDTKNRWERPPIEVSFDIDGYKLRVYNIHTKPEAVKSELDSLESIASTNGNSLILGDLNAGGSYYNHSANHQLASWHWVINDNQDTTSSKTDYAYDRIILDEAAYKQYSTSGVFRTGITKEQSDHYAVWVEMKIKQ